MAECQLLGRIGLAITIGTIVIGPRIASPPRPGRVRDSVRYLADPDLGWLEIGTAPDGRMTIGPGERARKLLEEATLPVGVT